MNTQYLIELHGTLCSNCGRDTHNTTKEYTGFCCKECEVEFEKKFKKQELANVMAGCSICLR